MDNLITINKRESNWVEGKILEFENGYKFTIPGEFRNILVKHNVCRPVKSFYKQNEIQFNLNYFLGFSQNKFEDLFYYYKTYVNRIPQELFPVGDVDGGDLLCLNKISGEVYYWFHEEDDWGIDGVDKWPTLAANNLNIFLSELSFSELPSEKEIEVAKRESKVKITPISVKIRNEQREKQGLSPLTMEEWDKLLNG